MKKENYNIIGVMSGTSLDGVDLAHIHFTKEQDTWHFQLYETETVSYKEEWIHKLSKAIDFSKQELILLNQEYTKLLSEIIVSFINKNRLQKIDCVCSHGHTVLHQPEKDITLQIGNLPVISSLVKQKVICDFRTQDVLLGGQGAPLVPIGDRLLFSDYDYCLNLGGFSNVSFEEKEERIAFDIAAVNTVLNHYAGQLGFEYDDSGDIARSGKINEGLLKALNTLDFYKKAFPKSLGFEFVKDMLLPLIDDFSISIEDKLNTFVEHIAVQTAFVLPNKKGRMLITGGGVYNKYLIERIQYYLPEMKIVIPDHKTIEFKEALIFGLLGVLRLRNQVNVLSSVTGACRDHSSGVIFDLE